MGKVCSFARHTTLLLSGFSNLKWKLVKNAIEHGLLLFTGAEKRPRLACYLCKI
jgi:hypothetical protein